MIDPEFDLEKFKDAPKIEAVTVFMTENHIYATSHPSLRGMPVLMAEMLAETLEAIADALRNSAYGNPNGESEH